MNNSSFFVNKIFIFNNKFDYFIKIVYDKFRRDT